MHNYIATSIWGNSTTVLFPFLLKKYLNIYVFNSLLYCFHNTIKEHHQRLISVRSFLWNMKGFRKKEVILVFSLEKEAEREMQIFSHFLSSESTDWAFPTYNPACLQALDFDDCQKAAALRELHIMKKYFFPVGWLSTERDCSEWW